jgi:hypothetical protein
MDLNLRNQRDTEAKVDKFIFNNMRKDKVYELKIDEEDEISGIDSISLVDEPAIEVNWIAFNKVKPEDFHIPDGQDKSYLDRFTDKGTPEEELLSNGWEVYEEQEKFVSSSPNAPSFEDTDNFLYRYKYVLNPEAPGAPIKETTREFCRELLNKNFVYRVEDMERINNDEGSSALVWRGGYNCRHSWKLLKYRRGTDIINKGSITKGRVDGVESYDVIGYPQPDTRTSNPSFSKDKFEEMSIFGFKPRYFYICPGAIELFKHLITMEMDEETVGMVRSAAQIADNVFRIEEEVIKSELATPAQVMEADLLIEDFKDVMHEIDELVGMAHDVSFMDGHLVKIKEYLKEDMGYDVGTIGGYVDPGVKKKKKDVISKSIAFETYNDYPDAAKNNACKVLRWRDEHGDEVKGMTRVGWTRANQLCGGENISESTIARMAAFARHRKNADVAPEFKSTPWKDKGYVAWLGWGGTTGVEWASRKLESIRNNMSKQKFQTDDEKKMVVGPAMIPDLKIIRKDMFGNPYYVFFSAETIKMIAEKYMKNKYIDNNDTNHDGKAVSDVYVVESWIKEYDEDKSNKYGYSDLPVGTWFVSMKVRNDEVWKKVKNGELKGFSVSGFFEEIADFAREHMFLQEVVKILNKYE